MSSPCFYFSFYHWKSKFIWLISYSSLKNIKPVKVRLLLICFIASFLFSGLWLFTHDDLSWSTRMSFFFSHPLFFCICDKRKKHLTWNNLRLPPHLNDENLVKWVLLSFPWFQMTIFPFDPCFILIRYTQSLDRFCKDLILFWRSFYVARYFLLRLFHHFSFAMFSFSLYFFLHDSE